MSQGRWRQAKKEKERAQQFIYDLYRQTNGQPNDEQEDKDYQQKSGRDNQTGKKGPR
jgi:hypothetical protein